MNVHAGGDERGAEGIRGDWDAEPVVALGLQSPNWSQR